MVRKSRQPAEKQKETSGPSAAPAGTPPLQSGEPKTKRDAEKPEMETRRLKERKNKNSSGFWSRHSDHGGHLVLEPTKSPQAPSRPPTVLPAQSFALSKSLEAPPPSPGQRSVTLFSRAAAICCRRSVSCLFWAAGSSSSDWMI